MLAVQLSPSASGGPQTDAPSDGWNTQVPEGQSLS